MNETISAPGVRPLILSEVDNPDHSGGYMMVVADRPDWVRVPNEPMFDRLAGQKVSVINQLQANCLCGAEHKVLVLELEQGLFVYECPTSGYLWAKSSKKK